MKQFELKTIEGVLHLCKVDSTERGLSVDFVADAGNYLKQKLSAKNDLLAKAVGLKKGLRICDLTLGLGKDAFKLNFLGATIHGVEIHPWMFALVQDALTRAQGKGNTRHFSIENRDALDFVENSGEEFDIYYIDPMFNHKRTALPKKEMQYLAEVSPLEDEAHFGKIIHTLKQHQRKIVVKRADKAPHLAGLEPKRSVSGKLIRFDIY
ncbi:MAG: class I SAM-dependent methyltransferase [Bdellovibrionales bacterium]|nr:class I SAM-dependent methyltransferase [Bdellovibrionales bacterium]